MGTYTTNYQLYMPTVGETGWGTLVNENFSTIDTTMKSLNNRITAVENEVNGNLSCTSVTTSGKVTANGGLSTKALTATTGTFSGNVIAPNISNRNVWIMVLDNTEYSSVTYPITAAGFGSVSAGNYGQLSLAANTGVIAAGATKTVSVVCDEDSSRSGIMPIIDVIVKGGSWSYTAITNNISSIATFNNKTITHSGISLTFSEVKQLLTKVNKITFKNISTSTTITSPDIAIRCTNTSSNVQSGYCVPYDTYYI